MVPPPEWNHDKYLKDFNGHTVKDNLSINNCFVPSFWNY